MNIVMRLFLFPLFTLTAVSAGAAVFSGTDGVVSTIPDGSSSGVARNVVINAPDEYITVIELSLNLGPAGGGPAFLGDLYMYLTNGTEIAVLTNRAGRTAGSPSGYSDNQSVSVIFTSGPGDDFHNYRVPLTGSNANPLTGPVTGTWQADGRLIDPALVLDTDLRIAGLDVFMGDAASGNWSLFAADLSTGATHQISSWTLTLTTVPEPTGASLALLALLGAARRRR